MANIKSQIKRIGTNEKARIQNAAIKSRMRTAIKKVDQAIILGEYENALLLLKQATSYIDKAVSDNVLTARSAARKKASLQHRVNALKHD